MAACRSGTVERPLALVRDDRRGTGIDDAISVQRAVRPHDARRLGHAHAAAAPARSGATRGALSRVGATDRSDPTAQISVHRV
jgi:hypothetical protein